MATQTVTVNMPETMYQRLRRRADQLHRTVEEETLSTLAAGMPVDDELPADLAWALESLDGLDDATLRKLAARTLSAEEAEEMELLHRDQRAGALSAKQSERLANLVRAYESNMLIRARAAVLLKQRGHDIQSLRGS